MRPPTIGRQALLTAAAASLAAVNIRPAFSDALILSAKLAARDAKLLTKPNGMLQPPEAAYPAWMEGEWMASLSFAGYELPAKDAIPREQLFAEGNVPGFQKCSLAFLPDVGKENVSFPLRWVRDKANVVREDRVANLKAAVRGGLGYDAIDRVEYKADPMIPNPLGINPNRLSLVFAPGLTNNAERIELFVNSRETEQPSDDLFLMSEGLRQLTFSASTKAGVARQVNGEYCHYWTFRRLSETEVRANILTAVYADALQLEKFFVKVGPNRPLILFSHGLRLVRPSVPETPSEAA